MEPDLKDDKEVVILGRTVRWKSWGIEWEADPKHRMLLMERFGYGVNTKATATTRLTSTTRRRKSR